jgi:hypothetical protein
MISAVLDPSKIRDISKQFMDDQGRLRVVPAADYANTTLEERAMFGVRNAFYGFLTAELIEFLTAFINGRSAIEIGAGHGELAAALGIPATDNHQQTWPNIAAYYQLLNQPCVQYGANVEKLDALAAIAKYQPQVVIGCWVTHKYDPTRHEAGGNEDGIPEETVIANCDAYLMIGNEQVHAKKSIWKLPHRKVHPPWLYSRAVNGSPNFIAIWENPQARQSGQG